MQRHSKIVLVNWCGWVLALSSVACAPTDVSSQSDEASIDLGEMQRKANFCAGKWELCKESDAIVSKATVQSDNYFPSKEDPSDIDGKRDAFRHIVGMTWVTLRFGNQFARALSNNTDPDPRSYSESNPQVVCQRQMDRINNEYAINRATSLAKDCDIPTNRRATKNDWEDYDNQAGWNCIAQIVTDSIRNSKSATIGPVTIARDPKNATKCWIVPSSQEIGTHGRPKTKY